MFFIKQKEKQSMGLLCFFHRNQTKIESICFLLKKRRNRAWVCCVFFTETKQNVLFGFCEKNTANPISVKKA